MDSAVTAAWARRQGFRVHGLSFDYGQRHGQELEAARRVAQGLGLEQHRTVRIDLRALGGSALTDEIEVPRGREPEEIGQGVPATYVPARNTVFLSVALGWAEVLGARDLCLGINAVDYSGYPDCRPEFLAAFERLAGLATAAGTEQGVSYRLHAPLMDLSKAEIVLLAEELDVDLAWTHTCYSPHSEGGTILACGTCDACQLRLEGFRQAGRRDPIAYGPRHDEHSA